jgi:hypothetical protein
LKYTYTLSSTIDMVPSPLVGEGQDEGEKQNNRHSPHLDPLLQGERKKIPVIIIVVPSPLWYVPYGAYLWGDEDPQTGPSGRMGRTG